MSGLRERKKADTRRALSDAALELAFEHGFDGVTREAIASLAGVSLRTFNNYFAGKYEALTYRITERMQRGIAAFRARPVDEPLWTSITEALVGTIEEDLGTPDHPEAFADRAELAEIRTLLLTPEVRNAIPQHHFDDWVDAIAERTGTDAEHDVYPRLVAAVLRAVGDVAMEAYAKSEPPIPYSTILRDALATVGAGLPEPHHGRTAP
ncbi:TetR family transcriptional regulator [Mycolicibacterium sediminis]|uniref:TetR family transcriptional regulator n=1 Tax=Mycolicibacterium sediminis TaxID=1286180 RepID=A0A7I7QQ82_9MYCO|nr:TetR family transcriptional regulator [Mycolicibacterium sediminis]BBY28454.1 TetR family transcriptional regulator [Mycolicibacterium sediminis]